MKKLFFILLVLVPAVKAQYYGERTTEQNFEESSLYFQSNYLNPFGIESFKNVSPGLINNPFLNLYINPASLPDLKDNSTLFYLDFRGDRTEAPIVTNYVIPYYYSNSYYRPYYDLRWNSQSRVEPEPVVSIGLLTYPVSELTKKFFVGGTFQFIHGEDKYYQMPYYIYSPVYAYDSFGVRTNSADASVPVQDIYSGRDEMVTDAKLYSLFAGYALSDKLTLGASLNGVHHSRDGGYGNSYTEEYGNTNNSDWSNSENEARNEKYHHIDISAGFNYLPVPEITIGFKAGVLKGTADQNYSDLSLYYYKYNTPEVSDSWSYYNSKNSTDQTWNHDGSTKYLGLNFIKKLADDREINFYYKYSRSSVDLSTSSAIYDTSYSSYRWISSYDTSWGESRGFSSIHDNRTGTGERIANIHEGMISFKWILTESSTINIGLYINSTNYTITSNEPVFATNESSYNYINSDPQYNSGYYQKLIEDKSLVWTYSSDKFTLQVPVLLNFKFGSNWGMMLGINRIFNSWDISDQTTAYFNLRERIQGSDVKSENNFGERYLQPAQQVTETLTKIFTSFDASITSSFNARLTIDPEFEHLFRINQWWLSFELKM
jgi:hypothetical protein